VLSQYAYLDNIKISVLKGKDYGCVLKLSFPKDDSNLLNYSKNVKDTILIDDC
jgi:hypothetical protein